MSQPQPEQRKKTDSKLNSSDTPTNATGDADTVSPIDLSSLEETLEPTSKVPTEDKDFELDPSLAQTVVPQRVNESSSPGATQDFVVGSVATADFTAESTPNQMPKQPAMPKMIGGYEIKKVLGRGGMGIVYKAKQKKLDRIVALKMVLAGSHASPDQLMRFISEAKAVGHLQHPNIVQIFDIGEYENLPFFSLEFVDGDSLDKQLAGKPQAPRDSAKLLEKLCRAMQYAHEHGILHRDLKPANVLMGRNGVPKITDFGLAKRLEDSDDSASTRTGTIMGTPSYMSPEQASGSVHDIGPATDQYSLGAMLYEFLIGRPPFLAAKVVDTILQVLHEEPVPPRQLQKNLPVDLETICLKALQKEQTKRYASCAEMADDLARYINNEPILARPIGTAERLIRLCRRYPREARLLGLVASLLLLLTAGAVATAYRINQDRQNISQQRDQITKQRDEISAEKSVSDQRLTTYRTTVSQLVNRAPSLMKEAPLGSGTREEFLSLIGEILDKSEDTGAVGPSRQWGQEAVLLRQGESLLSQGVTDFSQSDKLESAAAKIKQAGEKFAEAEKVAQEVYDQKPIEMSKAAGNLAVAVSRRATAVSYSKAPLAEISSLHKRAIELRRKALSSEQKGESESATRKAELGVELYRYAEFLLSFQTGDPVRFATRAMENVQEARDLLRQAIDEFSEGSVGNQNARQDLGLSLRMLARAAERLGMHEQADSAFSQAASVHRLLATEFPNRFSYRNAMVSSANAYGDYLLGQHADAVLIEQQYTIAMQDLQRTFDSPELRSLQHGVNGLAMQFYRLGTVCLQSDKKAESKRYFEQSGLLREMAWNDTLEELGRNKQEIDLDRLITQRIELMLTKARCGQNAIALEHAKWLFERAERLMEETGPEGLAGNFFAKQLYLQSAAALGMVAQSLPVDQQPAAIAKALEAAKKAIGAGFRDANYLRQDADLDALQNLDEYQRLISALDKDL